MRTETPKAIFLKDYTPVPYVIRHIRLNIRLDETDTRVVSRFAMEPRGAPADIELNGENLRLVQLKINGAEASAGSYEVTDDRLIIRNPPAGSIEFEIEQSCNPSSNTELSGLYLSNGMYCTQMEAEGFRRFAYFYDRPDVMATYEVRIEAPLSMPILLSNGNPGDTGASEEPGRHFAIWHDPHPKPTYLFALVAGDLACVDDSFTTSEGREVILGIYVEKGKEDRCAWAMDCLKASMLWDERRFGCAYDLDVFNIVAVSNFNMGAMENKGLNIFNDKYVLARPETATDTDYVNIEAIIAHEYFHNWTGNRITCRDWFQLCLKEGLTVYRDQEFTSDLRSRAVKRIQDVRTLRSKQFPEDQGPLAHPVRPTSYIEINNFYTPTVYEKGAELCRMLHTLIGADAFRSAMDLYFQRHDGEAATVEDFVRCMADASGRDLALFFRWYEQAGTPVLAVTTTYDQERGEFAVSVKQSTSPTPGQAEKLPLHMPLALGLISPSGRDVPLVLKDSSDPLGQMLELKTDRQSFTFAGVEARPVLSFNRGFSCPAVVHVDTSMEDMLFLVGHDTDSFVRWDTAQTLGRSLVIQLLQSAETPSAVFTFAEALRHVLLDPQIDDAFKALMLMLPPEAEIAASIGRDVRAGDVHSARERIRKLIASSLRTGLLSLVAGPDTEVYTPDTASAAHRSLRAAALALLAASDKDETLRIAERDVQNTWHMTGQVNALTAVLPIEDQRRDAMLDRFFDRNQRDSLIIDKWFQMQAQIPGADSYKRIEHLLTHKSFTLTTPNRVYSLIGQFTASNLSGFHATHGEGYRVVADVIMALNEINGQVAARIATGFRSWKMFESQCRSHAQRQMKRILDTPGLKRDIYEIISRTLGA